MKLPRIPRFVSLPVVALLGAVAAVVAFGFEPGTGGNLGPGRVDVGLHWDRGGRTRIGLPPLGAVSARTHAAPVTLDARIDRVDVQRLQRLLAAKDPGSGVRRDVERDLRPLIAVFARRTLLVSALVGAVVGAVLARRSWPAVVAGALGAALSAASVLVWTWRSYDDKAFANPRFEGALVQAPDILRTVRRHVRSLQDVRGRVDVLSRQVANLYENAAGPTEAAADDTAILHVSDVHLNPLGLEVASQLAERFKVVAILDTGDITSFGLPIESRIGGLLARMPVPYYFVPGNHDLPAVRQTLAATPNVTMVDGRTVDIGGVRVLGVADPTFTADNKVSAEQATAVKRAHAPAVAAMVDAERPDVLAVHDATLAAAVAGHVPLVVAGHTHRQASRAEAGTRFQTVGSMGASGLGSFTVTAELPYEAEVLHFSGARLTAVDSVSLKGVGGAFRVDRQVFPAATG
ncbi:MAG: metallophosphoesterase family protein [Actinobacteria bacterium]|nr:metallophosphoesterase family protein [Actinomycetota bacterium]